MNISKQTLQALGELYSFSLSDEYCNTIHAEEAEQATRIVIGWERASDGREGPFCKSIRAKKGEITLPWIMGKINQESIYRNFCETFKKLLDQTHIDLYPTSYGIGVGVAFSYQGSAEVLKKQVEDTLEQYGIEYTNECSSAGWVYRYKISKSQANIERINQLPV